MSWITNGGFVTIMTGVIAIGLIKWLFTKILSREKTVSLALKWNRLLYRKLLNYDIPVITGEAEDTLKDSVKMTAIDVYVGGLCGILDIDPVELMKQIDILIIRKNNLKKAQANGN